jgi:microcompartment protein CcmL/EutN
VRGPLADVEAAVAAGGAAAARVGECLIRHVIARPDEQLEKPLAGAAGSGGAPSP